MKFLLIISILAILVIVCLIVRGINDEMYILDLEERLDEANRDLKNANLIIKLTKQKNEQCRETLEKIKVICDNKKIRAITVVRGQIKELVDNLGR